MVASVSLTLAYYEELCHCGPHAHGKRTVHLLEPKNKNMQAEPRIAHRLVHQAEAHSAILKVTTPKEKADDKPSSKTKGNVT